MVKEIVKQKKSMKKNSSNNLSNIDSNKSLAKIKNIKEFIREYNITDEHVTLKVVLDKVQERIEYYIKILIQILQPEEFHSLHECTIFDDKEKARIFEMYKRMMILHREVIKAEILNTEDNITSTLIYAHSELINYKPGILELINKMQDSWKKNTVNGRERYFG